MHSLTTVERLSDRDLLDATMRVAGEARQLTAQLLALLGEVDARRLYLGQSCSSLFSYCTNVLRLSEHAAYHRIEAARAARHFPVIIEMVAEGALTLTAVALLRRHLTRGNHTEVLEAARHKSKNDIEHLIARLAPRPDERALVRRVPTPARTASRAPADDRGDPVAPVTSDAPAEPMPERTVMAPRPKVEPLAPHRYLLKVTVSAETHQKLRRAQDLLRHTIPNGDPAAILDRALTVLVDHLERTKAAKASRPRRSASPSPAGRSHSRHIPAPVRRAVWARDEGRCAFVGARGRCTETGRLEYHHVIPFADTGLTTTENLALRCRAHNAHEATLWSP